MASAPWIADLLVTSLQLYLSTEQHQVQDEHQTFEFKRNNSNLTIATKTHSPKTLILLEWQFRNTRKSVRAFGTDGGIRIQIDFLTPPQRANLVVGTTLQFNDFDIALADNVEPPRAKLSLRNYVLGPAAVVPETNQLLAIHNHPVAGKHLRFWKQQDTTLTMNVQPSSPTEIRSQVGDQEAISDDHDDREGRHPSSSSQAQFATQLPVRYSPKTPKTPKTQSLGRDGHYKRPVQKPGQANCILSNLPEHESRQPPSLQNNGDTASNMADLTQKQLVVPLSSAPKDPADGYEHNKDVHDSQLQNGKAQSSDGDINNLGVMPDAVFQLIRHWRKECHDGRYVPRRLQSIPKDQATLLESDDRWQPPLVGHHHRLGAVPLDLMNYITDRTDAEAVRRQRLSNIASNVGDQSLRAKEYALHRNEEESANPSDEDTESSVCPSWDASPVRPPANHRSLPPDSPAFTNVVNTIAIDQSIKGRNSEADRSGVITETEQAECQMADDVSLGKSIPLNDGPNDLSTKESIVAVGRRDLPPSTSRTAPKTGPTILQRLVQVKRTPYHQTAPSPAREIPDSSPVIIPGTFDERHTNPTREALFRSLAFPVQSNENASKGDITFEADSSEDEVVRKRHYSTHEQTSRTISNSHVRADRPSAQDVINNESEKTTEINNVRSKRKVEATQAKPPKRLKLSEQIHETPNNHDYTTIDEDRTHYRRQFFKNITSKSNATEQIDPHIEISKLGAEPVIPPLLFQQDTTSSISLEANQADQIGTSDTHASVHRSIGQASPEQKNASIMSELRGSSDLDLFNIFMSNYPSYGGARKQFYAACQLLRKLYSQGKATHPSLWDDFVFRHFHDYRKHLEEVMENCGNALPYERFYEERVEQPTHLQRIIKPSHFNNIEFDLTSPTRPSFLSAVISVQKDVLSDRHLSIPAQFGRSVPTDNLISHIENVHSSQNYNERRVQLYEHLPNPPEPHSPVNQKVASQERNQSQDSRTSVKVWLERASGAESPILGTPAGPLETTDVPKLELSDDDGVSLSIQLPIIEKQHKRRSLPWSSVTHRDPPSTNSAKKERVTIPSTLQGTARSSPQTRRITSMSAKKSSNQTRPNASTTSPPLSRTQHKPKTQPPPPSETTFTRFARFYSHLDSEKEALTKDDTNRSVDISRWRD